MSRPPLLIHLHIPKNAGTTLSRMLKLGLLLREPTALLRPRHALGYYHLPGEDRLQAVAAAPEERRSTIRFYEAHCGWGVHERLPRPSRYITVLREPVDRALSVYSYVRERGEIPPSVTLEQFLASEPHDPVWYVDNAQVRYLAGERGEIDRRPVGTCTREMLEKAEARLRGNFLLVGMTERFDESCVLLLRRLRWRLWWYVRSNVTVRRTRTDEISPATLRRVREMNELDIELYACAARLFEEQVGAAGPGFASAVRAFRARSAIASRLLARPLESVTAWGRARRRRARERSARLYAEGMGLQP